MKYRIHEDVLARIPDGFWAAFAEALERIFGDALFLKDEDGFYGVFFLSGTMGWNEALKSACESLDLMWLYTYYDSLEWWQSDMFDGEFVDLLVQKVKDF